MDTPTPLVAYQAERQARREGKEPAVVAPAETPDAVEAKTDAPVVTPIEAPSHERFTDPDTNEVLDLRTRRGKRIQALVAERNTLRDRLAQAARPAIEPKTPPAAVAKTAVTEPDPSTYPNKEFDAAFLRDHAAFTAQKAVTQAIADQQETSKRQSIEQELVDAAKSFDERAAAFAKATPDYDTRMQSAIAQGVRFSDVMIDAMHRSEVGPQIAYHLISNPDQAKQWQAETRSFLPDQMPFIKRQLEALVKTAAAPVAPQSRISNAPPPAPAVSGAQVPPAARVTTDMPLSDYRKAREQRRRNSGLATV